MPKKINENLNTTKSASAFFPPMFNSVQSRLRRCVCVCVCVYVYIYMYIHVHMEINTYYYFLSDIFHKDKDAKKYLQ